MEDAGQLAIYREEIRKLNASILKKNYSIQKLVAKVSDLQRYIHVLENSPADQKDMDALLNGTPEGFWNDFDSENPDLGKATKIKDFKPK